MIRTEATRRRAQAFTLIELLVAMAITAILLGLIFGPMVQGFNLTNRARVQALSQDTARRTMEITQRDVSNGVFVFDNTTEPVWFWVNNQTGNPVPVPVYYAAVDLVQPVRYIDQQGYAFLQQHPELIDPTTGQAMSNPGLRDALRALGAQYVFMADPALPLAPGRTITRYWVGLRDNSTMPDSGGANGRPRRPYLNYYEHPAGQNLADHNPCVLYRAVVSPYTPAGKVDTRFFHVDANGNPILYDPNFFYDNSEAVKPTDQSVASNAAPGWKDLNADGKVNIAENWKAIAEPLVPTDRADELTVERGDNGLPVYMQAPDPRPSGGTNNVPKLASLARFQPTFVGNDAGVATNTHDTGNEVANMPPSTNQETYGAWTTPFRVYVFRSALNANPLDYFVWDGVAAHDIRHQTYDANSGSVTLDESANFYPGLFNPDASSVNMANPPASTTSAPKIMFTADARRGVVNFAFPDWLWLHNSQGQPQPSTFTPQDANGTFDPANPTTTYRYVSLANLPPATNPTVTSPLTSIPSCVITPGSETVTGPDQRPGPHYGKAIEYTRVARAGDPRNISLNEYMINYANIQNGTDVLSQAGTIIFDSQPDSTGSANSMPTQDASGNPAANIVVTYQIQSNRLSDVVKVDYLTRQLMTFALGVRLYDFSSGQPQQVNLTQKVRVRNLQR